MGLTSVVLRHGGEATGSRRRWTSYGNRIAARCEYESHDAEGQWWRSHGNELWEFDGNGLLRRRDASINDYKIDETERKFRSPR